MFKYSLCRGLFINYVTQGDGDSRKELLSMFSLVNKFKSLNKTGRDKLQFPVCCKLFIKQQQNLIVKMSKLFKLHLNKVDCKKFNFFRTTDI